MIGDLIAIVAWVLIIGTIAWVALREDPETRADRKSLRRFDDMRRALDD